MRVLAQSFDVHAGRGTLCRDAVAAERRTLSRARTGPAAAQAEERWKRSLHNWRRCRSHNPVLMIFEDAHWIDPTSLEVFGRTVDRIRTFRVLLIVTFRPEFEPPWIGRPHVTALTLNRLGEREVAAMIDRVVGNKPLPASMSGRTSSSAPTAFRCSSRK